MDTGRNHRGWFERQRVRDAAFIGITILAAAVCYLMAAPFLPAIGWAIALAVLAYPIDRWIGRRVRREGIVALLTVALVTIVIIAPAVLVVRTLVQEAAASVEEVRSGAAAERWRQAVERNPRLAPALEWIEREIDIRDEVGKASRNVIEGAGKFVAGSVQAGIGLLVTLFLLFYFLRDRRKLLGAVRGAVPLSERDTDAVFADIRDAIIAIVFGILVVATVQGGLGGLMFWWLGLPAPLLWGSVMALLSIIPVLGAFVVWAPAAVFLALEGNWDKALILTAWGAIAIGLIDNLLYPMLVKNRLQLHTVPVFIAVVGGLILFGAVGIVLGPVVLVVTAGLIEIWRRRMAAESHARPAPARRSA